MSSNELVRAMLPVKEMIWAMQVFPQYGWAGLPWRFPQLMASWRGG